ncbi:MAG: hypothetical protein AB7Q17_03765 [Phycisphaerae bacterium]
MIRFCTLFAVPFVAVLLLNTRDLLQVGWRSLDSLLLLTAGPLLAASAGAWFAEARCPRRWAFDSFGRSLGAAAFAIGAGVLAIAGCAAVQAATWWSWPGFGPVVFLLPWDSPLVGSGLDVTAVVAPALFAATAAALMQPARRAGTCRRCEYDVSRSLEMGRCPECAETITGR